MIDTGSVFDADALLKARRDTLILVASWLFNQKGIEATSLDEIALEVGVRKKVIYHNISGKSTLVAECYRRTFKFFGFIADCAETATETESVDFLDAICMNLVTLAAASKRRDIAPLAPISGHEFWSKEEGEDLRALVSTLIDQALILFEGGEEDGSIRPLSLLPTLQLRPGFYEWMPRWSRSLSKSEMERTPSELTNVFRLGLAPLDS